MSRPPSPFRLNLGPGEEPLPQFLESVLAVILATHLCDRETAIGAAATLFNTAPDQLATYLIGHPWIDIRAEHLEAGLMRKVHAENEHAASMGDEQAAAFLDLDRELFGPLLPIPEEAERIVEGFLLVTPTPREPGSDDEHDDEDEHEHEDEEGDE